MLPELINEQDKRQIALAVLTSENDLGSLATWLEQMKASQRRSQPPAWIEVIEAIINVTKNRLASNTAELDDFVFETHIIAAQVRRQRNDDSIATRFVTDELGRLNNHFNHYLETIAADSSVEKAVVIGWCYVGNRRGIGIALANSKDAKRIFDAQTNGQKQTLAGNLSRFTHSVWQQLAAQPATLVLGGIAALLVCFQLYSFFYVSEPASTVDAIVERGELHCGVDGTLEHFSMFDDAEQAWWGIDVELCTALAVALNVKPVIKKVSDSDFDNRIQALLNREIDILFRNTSLTAARDLDYPIDFGPYYFYESEYFLDLSNNQQTSSLNESELKNKKICVKPGSSNESSLTEIQQNIELDIVTHNQTGEPLNNNIALLQALRTGGQPLCDFVFGNYYVLKQIQTDQVKRTLGNPTLRFYEKALMDPLAPVILADNDWQKIVDYVLYVIIHADRLGINSYTLANKTQAGSSTEKIFISGENLKALDLPNNWVSKVITEIGSYNEIYYRSFICGFAKCRVPDKDIWEDSLKIAKEERWPNYVFDSRDPKPGLLHTPRF